MPGSEPAKQGARAGVKLTPVMQQYLEIKRDHEDAILFFRLGDFYEMFFEDAERASAVLDITLTSRNRNDPNPIPLCGVPFHSARPYIAKLIDAGFKVAVCEQVELPGPGSKIAQRRVTKVVTPGTAIDEESLDADRARYLASVCRRDQIWGLCWTDFSTGEVAACETGDLAGLAEELAVLAPKELLVEASEREAVEALLSLTWATVVQTADPASPSARTPFRDHTAADAAWAALDAYLHRVQGDWSGHLGEPVLHETTAFLHIDAATRRNLELTESYAGKRRGSLLGVVDASVTSMGRRQCARWFAQPLALAASIGRRLDAVEFFVEAVELRALLRENLKSVGDLERLTGRVGSGNAGPRDVRALASALHAVAKIKDLFAGAATQGLVSEYVATLDALPTVCATIEGALVDEPPAHTRNGGMIRTGYDEEADRLGRIAAEGRGWIAEVEADERKRSGIATLKIGFNKVFGYYLEVSKANQHLVPDDYQRKQTLSNAERYVTPALKEKEGEVLGAQERLVALEASLFDTLCAELRTQQTGLASTARALAALDAACGLAETAHTRGYIRPHIHEAGTLRIVAGRHPVVEAAIGRGFVANDCELGDAAPSLAVITGPNMAGKSTYLRQTALICLMAHAGSFVPATESEIPVLDRIFTRIGASDDLAGGRSTFMVEMSETSQILAHMGPRSLVVLDEIGRGTSTYDGISIAWAVAEALLAAGVKTLFATHYHELAALADEHSGATNLSVAVKRYKGEVVFLYRVLPGAASGSYGIDVAKLAGVPAEVIARASELLDRLQEGGRPGEDGIGQLALFAAPTAARRPAQVEAGREESSILQKLRAIDPDTLTPIEAINLLHGLVRAAQNGG